MTRTRIVAAACTVTVALTLAACGGSTSSSSSGSAAAASSGAPASSAAPASSTVPGSSAAPASSSATGYATSKCASLDPPTISESAPSGGVTVDEVTVTGQDGKAPDITVGPAAEPATELITKDIVVGDGAQAKAGGTVTVNYCGVGLLTRSVFDSSWARGEPVQFPLSGLIPGWEEGIPGMKAGGRRLLIIPGSLAYGAEGTPDGSILPDETLAFVVDLVSVP